MPEKGRATSSLLALSTVGWLMATLPALGAEPSKPGDLPANPGARLLASDLVVFGRSLSPVVVGAQVGGSDGTLASPPQTVLTHPIAAPSDVSDNRRPLGLVLLFASYSSVQTLDFNLTMRAVNAGATERNPFIAALVERPAAFAAFKAATTAGTILAADRLARHSRVAAYCLMIAMTTTYAAVAVHNYRLAAAAGRPH